MIIKNRAALALTLMCGLWIEDIFEEEVDVEIELINEQLVVRSGEGRLS